MNSAVRCPFCVAPLPKPGLIGRLLSVARRGETCARCGRRFSRRTGQQVSHLYDHILQDFENRLANELRALRICDRAEVLVQFGLKMEDAKVASVDMLMRSLAAMLDPQLAQLARGCEGRLNINKVERGNCAVVDIDALVEDGRRNRRRLRIARIDANGFIQADLTSQETVTTKFIAR